MIGIHIIHGILHGDVLDNALLKVFNSLRSEVAYLVFLAKEAETMPGGAEDEDDGEDEETDDDESLGVLQLGGELGLVWKEVVAEARETQAQKSVDLNFID